MKKVAIFTEGQSELIFIRNLIPIVYGYERASYRCMKLKAKETRDVPYDYESPNAVIYFFIINVEGDEKVVGAIKEYEEGLIRNGYEEILGLRDMYSEAYCKLSHEIDDEVTTRIIQSHMSIIRAMRNPDRINLYFAIMEFEAWLLSMYNLFAKINRILTVEYIEERLGFNLRIINPEKEFFHPTSTVGRILNLAGIYYNKSVDQMESILESIDGSDILEACENGRCNCFSEFYGRIENLV